MRICLVSQEVSGVRGGGIGTYVVEAGRALRRAGHETCLLTRGGSRKAKRRLASVPGFDRVVLADLDAARAPLRFEHGEPHYGYSTLVHAALQRPDMDFDYVEFPDYRAEGLVSLQEQRCFGTFGETVLGVTLHTPSWESWMADRQAHRADLDVHQLCALEDEAIRIAPLVHSPSSSLAQAVAKRLDLDREIRILRYPMELPTELPEGPRSGRRLDELSFLYFGRLEPRKGVIELVEAFGELPHLALRLIGADTPLSAWGTSIRADLESRLPPNVEILDAIDREKLLAELESVDVCLFPSLFENWPNVCLEAMAAGRIVIGSRQGGMAEMIEDGTNGFLIDGGSSEAVVRVLTETLPKHLDRFEELGGAAARRARALSAPRRFSTDLERNVESARSAAPPATSVAMADRRVSVVLPFDGSDETRGALRSLRRQTHPNVRTILVASSQAEAEAARALRGGSQERPPARVVVSDLALPGALRNCGIRQSDGGYVLFLEPRERLLPEAVQLGLECLERNPASVFASPQVAEAAGSSAATARVRNPLPFDRSIALLGNRFGAGGTLFRRSLFEELEIRFDELLRSEVELALWLDLDHRGLRGEWIPRPLCETLESEEALDIRRLGEHQATMGLLIERHWHGSAPADRRALIALFATAGTAIADAAGGRRMEIATAFAELARRAPRLAGALQRGLGGLRAAAIRRRGHSA